MANNGGHLYFQLFPLHKKNKNLEQIKLFRHWIIFRLVERIMAGIQIRLLSIQQL